MKLKPLASNMTELSIQGADILFSYQTPVAAIIYHNQGSRTFLKTDYKWSVTTTKHINKWAGMKGVTSSNDSDHTRPQRFFDALVSK